MLEHPSKWYHGYGISRHLGIAAGSMYPALARLRSDGLLEARWEIPEDGGRPRHLYRLTARGSTFARSVAAGAGARPDVEEVWPAAGAPAWTQA